MNELVKYKYTLENYKGAITNGQSRETGNIGHIGYKTKTNKTKTQHNTVMDTISYF